jgi:hypothetical protein
MGRRSGEIFFIDGEREGGRPHRLHRPLDGRGPLRLRVKAGDEGARQQAVRDPADEAGPAYAVRLRVIRPERLAKTPASEQVKEAVGSSPFRFEPKEWASGASAVRCGRGSGGRCRGRKPRPRWPAGKWRNLAGWSGWRSPPWASARRSTRSPAIGWGWRACRPANGGIEVVVGDPGHGLRGTLLRCRGEDCRCGQLYQPTRRLTHEPCPIVVPARAGTHVFTQTGTSKPWIPAFAGMTG